MKALDRRGFLAVCSRAGVGSALLPGVLYALAAQAQKDKKSIALVKLTPELVDAAAALAGVTLTAEQKKLMLEGLEDQRGSYAAIRELKLANSVAPAFVFDPLPAGAVVETGRRAPRWSEAGAEAMPAIVEDLAFRTVRELAELVRTRKVTSVALTRMYLERLKRYDAKLHFVISLTEERRWRRRGRRMRRLRRGFIGGRCMGFPGARRTCWR